MNAIKKEKEIIESLSSELYNDQTSFFWGNENSELKIVEFIDYNCGYCKKTLPTISKLLKRFEDIKIVFVDFPILSNTSELASRAALAAYEQKKYFKYRQRS